MSENCDRKNSNAFTRRVFLGSSGALAGTLALPAFAPYAANAQQADDSTLIIGAQSDLRILDPVWTTSQVTANHAYMVYDTLFALDSDLKPQPQMVGEHEMSEDAKFYRFALRDGLMWHDGTPVTANDCVASIKRWSARRPQGNAMISRGVAYEVEDEKTFSLTFDEPFGMVHLSLSDPIVPCFMMREQEAATDPYEQIKTVVGSGPFIFLDEEWEPGNKAFYRRNPDYVPRDEPSDGLAGGKIAKVERVVWQNIPDPGTAANALMTGEVDILEFPPHDLLPMLAANPDTAVKVIDEVGYQSMLRFNSLAPPLDNPAMRQAILHLVEARQQEYLVAMVGDPEYGKECYSPFVCGTPYESEVGIEQFKEDGAADRVRALLEKAGYAGEPIVVLDPTDQFLIHKWTVVFAQHCREAGINIDLQATDWNTVAARRAIKASPSEDPKGWHIFPTWWPGFSMSSPLTNIALETTCDGNNYFGWPCDEKLESLRASFPDAQTDEERQEIADAVQARFWEVVPYVPVGQFLRPMAYREDRIKGVIGLINPVAWNIEKTV